MLPIQTGTGALTSKQVEILRSGYMCPVHTNTRYGLLLFLDKGRLPPDEPAVQWQILMYIATIFQGRSGTVVNVVRTGNGTQMHRPVAQIASHIYRVMGESVAYRNTGYFVVQAFEFGFEHLNEFYSFQEMQLTRQNMHRADPTLVAADSDRRTLLLLEETGFNRGSLPWYLGGNFDLDTVLNDWIRARLSLESLLTISSRLNNRQVVVPSAIRRRPDESEEDFIRRRSAFYSRRKYNKKSLKALTLEDQAKLALEMNQKLKRENQRLRDFLHQAQSIVEKFHPETTVDMFWTGHEMMDAKPFDFDDW